MSNCGHRAVLYVTRSVEGTATNVARERIQLSCDKPVDHDGPHADSTRGEEWEGTTRAQTTLFRHEDAED